MSKANIFFITTLGIILTISIPLIAPNLGSDDLIAYWSSARLLINGGNPYDQVQMGEIEKLTQPSRFDDQNPLLNSWNPPWLIIALTPIGFMPFKIAMHSWILITTFIIALAIRYTWKMLDTKFSEYDYINTILIGFTFGPIFSLLARGQISGILLISIILSIFLLRNNKDFSAGAVGAFALIKPHITYFFIIYIFIVVIIKKRWGFLWGFISTILLSFIIMWLILPDWIYSYIFLLKSLPYSAVYTSTLGSLISAITGIKFFQYIGLILLPLIMYISNKLSKNDLLTAINIGLLISIPLSPFGFLFDQIVLIPALVQIYMFSIKDRRFNTKTAVIIIGYLIINLVTLLLLAGNSTPYYWFFWIPFGILFIYLIAQKEMYAKIPQSY